MVGAAKPFPAAGGRGFFLFEPDHLLFWYLPGVCWLYENGLWDFQSGWVCVSYSMGLAQAAEKTVFTVT